MALNQLGSFNDVFDNNSNTLSSTTFTALSLGNKIVPF